MGAESNPLLSSITPVSTTSGIYDSLTRAIQEKDPAGMITDSHRPDQTDGMESSSRPESVGVLACTGLSRIEGPDRWAALGRTWAATGVKRSETMRGAAR
jgi:hypothetical protein